MASVLFQFRSLGLSRLHANTMTNIQVLINSPVVSLIKTGPAPKSPCVHAAGLNSKIVVTVGDSALIF